MAARRHGLDSCPLRVHAPVHPPLTVQIGQAKVAIQTAKGFDPAGQRLIHAGKVLKDEQTMTEAGVKEGTFLVCMVSKPKAAAPAPVSAARA
jgi:UV excision repair protein RAD23